MTIIEAIHDKNLFRPFFKDLSTWKPWLVMLKAIFGLDMSKEEIMIFQKLTNRTTPPTEQTRESWMVIGRRGGKSFIVSLIAVFLACFRDYKPYLGPGERGVIMIIAVDRKQARVIMRYMSALIERTPMLAAMIEKLGTESVDLTNKVSIEITTCSHRSVRGYTCIATLLDETAFWRSEESACPDVEIVNALRPSLVTIPGSLMIGIGSPYRRKGVLYDAYRKHFGQDDSSVLVFQAATRTMNVTVPQGIIDDAFEQDPTNASAEWMAEFRSDIGSFLDFELLDRAIEPGRRERPPLQTLEGGKPVKYLGFCDPSGGKHDSFTLGIAHMEDTKVVLDVIRTTKPPFSPIEVVREYCQLLHTYRCHEVTGDRYAGEWVVEQFRSHGVTYKPSPLSKSEIYLECLPLLTTGTAELLDDKRLLLELAGLERRTRGSGKDSVDHSPGSHDDTANAAAGALVLAKSKLSRRGQGMISIIDGKLMDRYYPPWERNFM